MEEGKIEVTVKTMDSGQQKFEVNEEVTVATFKEDIATQMNIPLERQRLIFQGKVLRDDKKLSEYGVANKVIHLVQKAPPTPNADGTSTSTTSTSSSGVTTATSSQFIVGTIPLRNPSNINPASITQHIAQHIAGQIAAATGNNTTTVMATHESQVTPSPAAATTVASSEETTDGASPNLGSRSEGHQVHSLLTQAHSLLMRCKQHLDQFDQESAASIQQLITSLDKGEQPMDTSGAMATDQSTSENATTATESATTATEDATTATENSTENTIPAIDGPYGATLLADVYDDMATVNGRLGTLQSKWASIVRSDIQLEESQAAIVNKLYTTIRTCQAHLTHVEVCTMRLTTQLTRPPPHVVELADTSSALAGLLQPSSERQFQIGPLSIMSQTYSIPQAVLHAHMSTTATPTTSVSGESDINQQLGGVISQVLDSMMNRTIGSSYDHTTPTTSTNASGSTGTAVTSVATEAVVSSQPVVSSSQPVASTAGVGSESEEVRSKLPKDTPINEGQSSSKDDQSVPMATEHPKEGSSTSDKVPSTAPAAPAEEQRRPRLTIRLVHRPRGAPRSSILDSDSDDDNTITINLNSDSDDEISDQPSGVETRDAEGNLTTEYRAMLNTLQRRQERRERQLVNILQHRRREIQNREVTQRLAQLTEARPPPPIVSSGITGAAAEGDGADSSSDEEMDPQEALAAVRRLTRSLLPMMLGPQGQLTIHDLWMDIQANRGPDWVPPDQTIVSHLLEYVARGLTVAQLFEIFSGSAEPMQGLHPYLLEFVREKLLDNEIPTPHNKQKAIDTLMERLQDYIDKIAEPVKVHPGINLRETINRCLKFSLGDVYDIIINKPEGDQAFGQALWGWCVNMAARIAAVTRHCMDGTEEEFQDVLRSFFTRNRDHGDDDDAAEEGMGVTPMSAFFTVSMVRRLNNFIEHCNFTQEDFDKFIVRDQPVDQQQQQQPGPSGSATEEAIEVPNNDNATLEASSEPVAMDTAPSEQWPVNMPQEWIPVIQYDVEYMATPEEDQSGDQQVPLSDAYMSGMPAKRRKVEKRPQSMPQVLQDCLQSAIVKTGVKPTSDKDVVKEIGNQEQLCQALGEELYMQTRQRLQEDKNYQPTHYPNAERYYRPHN